MPSCVPGLFVVDGSSFFFFFFTADFCLLTAVFCLFVKKKSERFYYNQSKGLGGIRTLAVGTKALNGNKRVPQCYLIGLTV